MKLTKHLLALFLLATSFGFAEENESKIVTEKTYGINQVENVQVLIHKNVSEALLEVTGPYYIYNPYDATKISSGILGKRFLVHALKDGIKWGQYYPDIHQLYIVPRSEKTSILVNGIEYDGAIAIYQIKDNISIVNDLSIEDFIKSTLTPQFSYPLDKETMAAVAIIARTNVYFQVSRNQDKFWHVDAADIDYLGSAMVAPGSAVDKAVNDTHHLILTNQNVPFAATWNEHCAGKTATYDAIFRKKGFSPEKGVDSPHAAFDREDSYWTFSMNKATIAKFFDMKEVSLIEPFIDKSSNKTYGLRLKGAKEEKAIDFITFQKIIGKNLLLSNDFSIVDKIDEFIFKGYGLGHGVGLCLHSATALSQNGDNAADLLKKFYPNTSLVNLSATPKFDELRKKLQ